MTNERKEALRAYKGQATVRGIFSIRCNATGDVWIGSAANLGSARNAAWFLLRYGRQRNLPLQNAWNTHGEQSFQFSVVEELDADLPPLLIDNALKKQKGDWASRLGATAL